ncbi:hypothetical protein ABZ543_34555 [Streptomyces roseifaciens]
MAVADGLIADHQLSADPTVAVAHGPPADPRLGASRVPVAGQCEGITALAVCGLGIGSGEVQCGGDVVGAAGDGAQQGRTPIGVDAVQIQRVEIGQLQQSVEDPVVEGIRSQAKGCCGVRAARVSGAVPAVE